MKPLLEDIIKTKILVLDGAMGTMIQKLKLQEADYCGKEFADHPKPQKGNNDLLTLTNPDAIKNIHRQYLEAGADIITSNTFNSNKISMADYGMENQVYRLNVEAVKNARETIDDFEKSSGTTGHFIAGTLGPTNRTASMSSDVSDPGARSVTFDNLVEAYSEQARGLIDGGADILLVETILTSSTARLLSLPSILSLRKKV